MKTDSIGKRLKMLRTQKELSAAKVAKHVGVSESTYRDWELGRAIQGEPYAKLAEIYGVGLSDILIGPGHGRAWVLERLAEIEVLVRELRLRL
jgi:transcriptional regulator with XRE-family HTH domain